MATRPVTVNDIFDGHVVLDLGLFVLEGGVIVVALRR